MKRRGITTTLDPKLLELFEELAAGGPINGLLEEAMREYLAKRALPPVKPKARRSKP